MKVRYNDGREENLTGENSEKLYIKNRFSKKEWKELEDEMVRLGILGFEEPLFTRLSLQLVSLDYVRDQVKCHQG